MEWYIPLTIIPGIGLIILSTSNIMLSLNTEISELEERQNRNVEVIQAKLTQLKRLSISIVFQYVGVLLFLISGIAQSIFPSVFSLSIGVLLIGVTAICVSILILLVYSLKAVHIRQQHLKL
ncbi:MAG: hypothetical protein QNK23_15345 [Crocinitomicaceae bacterium]|nr:hypothetical protein [Crocinitomicaceae bacterium]